jgi:peptide/nickel transport system substrate-binding protein
MSDGGVSIDLTSAGEDDRMRGLAAGIAAMLLAVGAGAETLTLGIKLGPSSMDPHYRFAGENDGTLQQLYARILEEQPDGTIGPGIAESWAASDGTTWEFRLRDGARFSDGTPVTADDVAFSLARVPRIEDSPGSYVIFTRAIAGTEVVDPRTLRIRTREPYPFLALDLSRIFVVPKSLGPAVKTADFNTLAVRTTSGPYRPVAWVPGDRLELEPNPGWYGGKVPWDRVVLRQIGSDAARVAALLAGDVQAIDEVPIPDIARLGGDKRVTLSRIAGSRVAYVAMDMDRDESPFVRGLDGQPLAKNPLKDVRVRKALSYGLNRQAIVDRMLEGAGTVAGNMLPDGVPGTSPNIRPDPFDPARAKALLAEAGYPDGFQLTLHATNDRYPNDEKVAQAIAQMWARIGIRTEVRTLPNATFFSQAAKQTFSVLSAQYGASDVSMMYRALIHTFDAARNLGSANRTRHSSPRADEIAREALQTMEPEKRDALFARAGEIALREDEAILLLYYPQYVYAATGGLTVTPYSDGRFLAHRILRR